jgi:hypothetical protein
MTVVFLACLLTGPAVAFHDGGVGACNGCHFTHAVDGGPVTSSYLLIGENSTDTCLRCHGTTAGNSWGMDALAPGSLYGGGQFVFLTEDNINDEPGSSLIISGDHAGHNVISPSMGSGADLNNATSPGGTYPSSFLTCTSCHDPHGQGNHFRFLYGSDYPLSRSGGYEFNYTSPAIQADGISIFGPPESDSHHTAYRSGVADWCRNCHSLVHEESSGGFEHPQDEALGGDELSEYNSYQGTGDNSGTGVDAYKVLVPYQDLSSPGTGDTGPASSSSRVMCLSCHRAHASSAPYAGRWDFNITTWADEGLSGSYPIPNPYPLIGPTQAQLCEKCHGSGEP